MLWNSVLQDCYTSQSYCFTFSLCLSKFQKYGASKLKHFYFKANTPTGSLYLLFVWNKIIFVNLTCATKFVERASKWFIALPPRRASSPTCDGLLVVAPLLPADAGLAWPVHLVAVVEQDAGGRRPVEGEPGARLQVGSAIFNWWQVWSLFCMIAWLLR